ncbi:MAG: glycosyltransferase 61 family protein, partial [Thermomicrobiales bacterium]
VIMPEEPTQFRRLIIPEHLFEICSFAHESATMAFHLVADRLCGDLELTDQPLYLGRSQLTPHKRQIMTREALLDEFLHDQGFRVIHPETLPLEEQIRLINLHRIITGPTGSAFHLTFFSRQRPELHLLSNRSFINNYAMSADFTQSPSVFAHFAKPDERSVDVPDLPPFDARPAADYLRRIGLVGNTDCLGPPPEPQCTRRPA